MLEDKLMVKPHKISRYALNWSVEPLKIYLEGFYMYAVRVYIYTYIYLYFVKHYQFVDWGHLIILLSIYDELIGFQAIK